MNIIILSGGSGKRLWPLSNDVQSKQFLKLFKNEEDQYQSMLQNVFTGLSQVFKEPKITIATSKTQTSIINNQLGGNVDISIEPTRRDTFPAIALACAFLREKKKCRLDEVIIVCPVDPYVDNSYYKTLEKLAETVNEGISNIALMGIEPTYPSEKYGYILPDTTKRPYSVKSFKEKPSEDVAKEYISSGGLWNSGVFAFKLGYLLDIVEKKYKSSDYSWLFDNYKSLEKISFDYAVLEKENSISVIPYSGVWKDIGTWNTLTETLPEKTVGNCICDSTCENVHILNELDIPIIANGLKDCIIAASPEGVLITDKTKSSKIKPLVEQVDQDIRFADKSWGSYRVIDVNNGSLTIKITLNLGQKMNYHKHHHRDEVWTVISGEGEALIGGEKHKIKAGDVLSMPKEIPHTVKAITKLELIEVQIGNDISVKDKEIIE